mgnify:CR=1 FL=1
MKYELKIKLLHFQTLQDKINQWIPLLSRTHKIDEEWRVKYTKHCNHQYYSGEENVIAFPFRLL